MDETTVLFRPVGQNEFLVIATKGTKAQRLFAKSLASFVLFVALDRPAS